MAESALKTTASNFHCWLSFPKSICTILCIHYVCACVFMLALAAVPARAVIMQNVLWNLCTLLITYSAYVQQVLSLCSSAPWWVALIGDWSWGHHVDGGDGAPGFSSQELCPKVRLKAIGCHCCSVEAQLAVNLCGSKNWTLEVVFLAVNIQGIYT